MNQVIGKQINRKMKKELMLTFGQDILANNILLLLRYTINSIQYEELRKYVMNGYYAGSADFEFDSTVAILKANNLIRINGNNTVYLGDEGHKLFEILPAYKWYKFNKKSCEPYTYFRKRRRNIAAGENVESWKKRNWFWITICSSVVSLGAGLLSGMYLERWKQQNLSEKTQQIPPKSSDQISPTKSSARPHIDTPRKKTQ